MDPNKELARLQSAMQGRQIVDEMQAPTQNLAPASNNEPANPSAAPVESGLSDDLMSLSDEEKLDIIATYEKAQKPEHWVVKAGGAVADFADFLIESGEGISESVAAGIFAGVPEALDTITLAGTDVMTALGLADEEDVRGVRSAIKEDRSDRNVTLGSQKYPTVAKGTALVTELAAEIAGAGTVLKPVKAVGSLARIGKGVIAGAGLGALANEEDRAGGALSGAGFAGGAGALGAGISKVVTPSARKRIQSTIKKVLPEGEVYDLANSFKRLLISRETTASERAGKLLKFAVRGKTGAHQNDFKQTKDFYKSVKSVLQESDSREAQTALTRLDKAFSGKIPMSQAKEIVAGNAGLNQLIKPLYRRDPAAANKLAELRKVMTAEFKGVLKDIDPRRLKAYEKGLEISQFKITGIEKNKELTNLIRKGDFGSITTALSKPTGGEAYKQIMKALGPKGQKIMDQGLLKNAFQGSWSKGKHFDAQKLVKTFKDIELNSGHVLDKSVRAALTRIAKLDKKLEVSIPGTEGLAREGLNWLLSVRPGLELIKSPAAGTSEKLLDMAAKIGTLIVERRKAADTPVGIDQLSREEQMQLLEQLTREDEETQLLKQLTKGGNR